jgi:hypothetical protein
MNEKQRPRRNQPALPDLERHARECTVCNHPDREDIEGMYLHWRSPKKIARSFKIGYRCIYRHAHATGLYHRRRQNVRLALETFLECSEDVPVTAMDIINAVRTYAHINDDGEWFEPPTTHRMIVERDAGPGNPALASIKVEELPPASHESNATN